MNKVMLCHTCKGKGYTVNKAEYAFFGVCTLGLIPFYESLFDMPSERRLGREHCFRCDGEGVVKYE